VHDPLPPQPGGNEPAERYGLILKPEGTPDPALLRELAELVRRAFGSRHPARTEWKRPAPVSAKAVAVDTGLLHDIDEEFTASAALVAEQAALAKQPDGRAEIDRRIRAAELAVVAACDQCVADQLTVEAVAEAAAAVRP
jgi:hypothetical protein